MNAREALLSVKEVIEGFGDHKVVHSYYLEFGRRLEILRLVERYCKTGFYSIRCWCTALYNLMCS
jgi:hypothetical protein